MDKEVKIIEKYLEEGLQESPGDPYLKVAESELNEMLKKHQDAIKSLETAFRKNPRDAFLAIRLAKAYIGDDDYENAKEVLEAALDSNRNDRKINYNYALVLKKLNPKDSDNLIYYFRRGFTKWDENYESQFWFARYCFESSDEEKRRESEETFKKLREAWIPNDMRNKVRDKIMDNGKPKEFIGSMNQVEMTFGFIDVQGSGREIFAHENEAEDNWDELKANKRVKFEIGFAMRGPVATNIKIYQ